MPAIRTPLSDPAQNRRSLILALIYAAIIAASLHLAYEIRFDFVVPKDFQQERLWVLPVAVGVKLIALIFARQFGSMMTYFSIPDLFRLLWAMAAASAVLMVPRLLGWSPLGAPRGVLLVDFMLCFGGLCVGRIGTRIYRERLSGAKPGHAGAPLQRIAIFGAGDAGATLAKEFIGSPSRGFRPVMFFDDDRSKHGKLVHGIPVLGRPEALAKAKDVDTLAKAVIAMPSASAKRIREIVEVCQAQGLKVERLPSLEELASGRVRASRIRPVEVTDLLGRDAVNLDSTGMRQNLENRCVMVTGAGGSIGSELCRQIAALNPKRLLMIEQCEGALFVIEQEMNELGFGAMATPLVGDILDGERMEFIFSRYQPEVVFHAAAHKHVYLMERQPAEAIRNNVLGTRQLAQIAAAHGVDAFVLISTDKAINPTNVMGATKRLAEIQLMAIAASQGSFGAQRAEGEGLRAEISGEGRREDSGEGRREDSGEGRREKGEGATRGGERQRVEHAGESASAADNGVAHPGTAVASVSSRSPSVSPVTANQSDAKAKLASIVLSKVEKLARAEPAGNKEFDGLPLGPSALAASPLARRTAPTKFMAVRFGNVLGSSGSVIPIFKRQIANGGPVTVTHPEVTRYFMTIPEAVGLVLQSFVQGKGGEIFVLDMGQPVKIADLAKQMIELSGFRVGEDIEITYTGLKPGEKLFEELQHRNEQYTPTEHPRIMRFTTNAMFSESGVQELEQRLYEYDSNQLKEILRKLVPEYTPFLD